MYEGLQHGVASQREKESTTEYCLQGALSENMSKTFVEKRRICIRQTRSGQRSILQKTGLKLARRTSMEVTAKWELTHALQHWSNAARNIFGSGWALSKSSRAIFAL